MDEEEKSSNNQTSSFSRLIDFDIIREVLSTIVYLFGVLFIEKVIRPGFGSDGIPFFENLVLTIGNATFFFLLIQRLAVAFRSCSREVTSTFQETLPNFRRGNLPEPLALPSKTGSTTPQVPSTSKTDE